MRHAIIGAGFGARAHLPAFIALPGVDLVAVSDNGSGRASELASFGFPIFHDWRKMLDVIRPDSVSVAVPPVFQREIVASALGRGIHVLCEKPLGIDENEALMLMNLADSANLTAAVGLQYRFEHGIEALRHQFRSGRIGCLRRINVDWITAGRADPARAWSWNHDAGMGGGVVKGFLPHVADLIYWLVGCEARSVTAKTVVLIPGRPYGSRDLIAVTAEDSLDALCEIDCDAIASIRVTNCQWGGDGMKIEIHGEKGVLRYSHKPPFSGNADMKLYFQGQQACAFEVAVPDISKQTDSRTVPLVHLVNQFANSVQGGISNPDLPTFRDGVRCQHFLGAVRRSAILGNTVMMGDINHTRTEFK
jgi:predicted dehydrogenase